MSTKLVRIRYFQPENSELCGNRPRWAIVMAEIDQDGWLSEIGREGRSLFQQECCHNHRGRYQAQIIGEAKRSERDSAAECFEVEE